MQWHSCFFLQSALARGAVWVASYPAFPRLQCGRLIGSYVHEILALEKFRVTIIRVEKISRTEHVFDAVIIRYAPFLCT